MGPLAGRSRGSGAFSRHLPRRLPLPCCSETEAFPSEADVNAAERSCFMETAVGTPGRLAAGLEVGLARAASLGHSSETPRGQQHTLCLFRGFLTEPAEETALQGKGKHMG